MKVAFINMTGGIDRGAGYIIGAITAAGHKVDFYNSKHFKHNKAIDKIVTIDYDVIMASSMTLLFPKTVNILKNIKSKKDIPILLGGIHVISVGSDLLKSHPYIDYLCMGEGESMVVEFLEKFGSDKLLSIDNLVYRSGNEIISNPVRPAEDLSVLPSFPWNLLKRKSVVTKRGMLYVYATRGCPYNCTYCGNIVYLKLYKKSYIRSRPINSVIEELKYLRDKYKPEIFYFGDEMIFANEKYARELFTAIYKEVKVPYGGMGRVESINPSLSEYLEETGCKYLGMGIECGNEEFRKKVLNRHMTNEQIKNAFRLCKKHNIFTTAFNMIGYPVDYDDELTQETIKFNQEIKPDFSQVTTFYPFVGTKLYDYCVENNLIDKTLNVRRYHGESILKGYKVKKKLLEISKLLNPQGFIFGNKISL